MRSALFWVVTQRVVAIPYRRLETTYLQICKGPESICHRQGLPDVKQQTGNKSLNRIKKAIGLYCSIGPPLQEIFLEMRKSGFNVAVVGGARVAGGGYIGAWDGELPA
jgi:hypothetical protein